MAPRTEAELRQYNRLRYEVLRKPWGEPEGSEMAPDDPDSWHVMAVTEQNEAVGVGRLHLNHPQEGQLRMMAVHPDWQGHGIGRLLVEHLEAQARQLGVTIMVLHAREKAVAFYKTLGYEVVEPSYLLFGQIPHFLMRKEL